MTTNVNFDELAKKAFESTATSSDYERLFAAVFTLPEWHFIANGEFPNIEPYCALFPDIFGEQPAVAVFTDANRANKYMAERDAKFGSPNKPVVLGSGDAQVKLSSENLVLSIPTTNILNYIETLIPKGIVKIFFNPNTDSHGFHHDLKMMRPIREHLENKGMLAKTEAQQTENIAPPVESVPKANISSEQNAETSVNSANSTTVTPNEVDFDELSRKANGSNGGMDDLNNLFGAVLDLPEWYFVARGETPNVHPYVASNPAYADNQPMVRAFTDGKRLVRFTKENSLTKEDVTSDSLIIPTVDVIEFLEQFVQYGAYGVWFNSDSESDGFFIPIKQLRPIKEHLAKVSWQSKPAEEKVVVENKAVQESSVPESTVETWQFIVKEGLMLPSGEIKPVPYSVNLFWRMPSDWVEDGKVKVEHLKKIELQMSGGSSESVEGAFYTAIDYSMKVFTSSEVRATKWSEFVADNDNIYSFYIASPSGAIKKVTTAEFQADVDASPQTTEQSEQPKPAESVEQKPSLQTAQIIVKDGLMMPSGFISQADYVCNFFCHMPSEWLDGEKLKEENLEKIYKKVYGETWRAGNDDGSRYVVIDSITKLLSPDDLKTINFSELKTTPEDQYWFYLADENGELKSLKAEEFQKEVDALFQHETDEARKNQDNLSDFGMSKKPDGGFDLNLSINQVGAVNFNTAIAPFYETIVPLLKDYQGTGEYVTLLRFETSGMSQSVENIVENAHGAYLQIRRFLYLNPKNNVRIGVNSIHSNHLRHVQSNAELIVSFELCKNLDNQTGALYYRFEGPKSDVLNLASAIQPLLANCGYEAVGQQ